MVFSPYNMGNKGDLRRIYIVKKLREVTNWKQSKH